MIAIRTMFLAVIATTTAAALARPATAHEACERPEGRRARWERERAERLWVGQPPVRHARPAPVAMWDHDFRGLLWSVRHARFGGERVAMIRSAAHHGHFTVEQAVSLVDTIAFSSQRVDAASALYPAVVDPWRFHIVVDRVPFWGDRETLRRRMAAVDAERQIAYAVPAWPRS